MKQWSDKDSSNNVGPLSSNLLPACYGVCEFMCFIANTKDELN